MRFDKVLYLLTVTYTQDALKQQIKSYIERKVYANEYSIYQAEMSAAAEMGLVPEFAFQVNTVEYAGESFVKYDGERFHVYRTQKTGDKTVLFLTRRVADDG